MRLTAAVAVGLISACMAQAQQIKQPRVIMPPAPGVNRPSTVAAPPVVTSSAAELAKIEQQTARLRTSKPVTHSSSAVAATPALDLGKNKPIRAGRSTRPVSPHSH